MHVSTLPSLMYLDRKNVHAVDGILTEAMMGG